MNADMLNRGTEDRPPPSLSLSLGGGGGRTSPPPPSGSATDQPCSLFTSALDQRTPQMIHERPDLSWSRNSTNLQTSEICSSVVTKKS
jgi:hypothetical protein